MTFISRVIAATALAHNGEDTAVAARLLGLKPAAFKKLLEPPAP
jgi:hypothetical protein